MVDMLRQLNTLLKEKNKCKVINKIFHNPSYEVKNISNINVDSEKVNFQDGDVAANGINQWINEFGNFKEFSLAKYISPDTSFVLTNISIFKDTWNNLSESNSPIMKVYNSFSYTEDVKYEARLLELPMSDSDFKLVIIVPNEVDTLEVLYKKLIEDGLVAAVNSIQPLFTAVSELRAPKIEVNSETEVITQDNNKLLNCTKIQCGIVNVDETGANIKVVTCIFSPKPSLKPNKTIKAKAPFFFSIIFKDTVIFTGEYIP